MNRAGVEKFKKEIKTIFDLIICEGVLLGGYKVRTGFTSIALIEDHKSHSIPNGGWRFEIFDDKKFSDINKLTRFWLALGGTMGREMFTDSDWSRIYFWNETEAKRIKEKSVELKLPNPFRGLKKSIYNEDFEKFLLM